jgi:hypothetical protein
MVTGPVLNRRCPAVGKRIDFVLFTIIPNKYESSDNKTIINGARKTTDNSLPSIWDERSSINE